jgi:hypothetical protein
VGKFGEYVMAHYCIYIRVVKTCERDMKRNRQKIATNLSFYRVSWRRQLAHVPTNLRRWPRAVIGEAPKSLYQGGSES